ncbi:MAG: hypothetical protein LAN59_06830 [Acidobacteriia bacterium]|nr:hypothetical protein [Terriglobia bacterium]
MHKQRLTVGAVVVLILSLLGGSASRAQAEKDVYDPNVSYDCDRACLNGFVDQYLAALVAHDPARLPLARDVKFTENGQALKLGDGLWGTASAVTTHKIYADDPQAGQVLFLGALQENGAPIILALRLKVEIRRITEIETVVTRKEAGSFARPEAFVAKPIFSETLAPPERRSRQNMIAIANSYFSAIERGNGTKYVPFDKDCNRVEDGVQTTNNPSLSPSGNSTSVFGLGCAEQIKLGEFQPDTAIRDRRFLVVDEERGLVFVFGFFDHDAQLRSYTRTDGRTVQQTRTAPWTWEIAELFKIQNGKIRQIEALVNAVPYTMKPGW